jgi:hypothetical protein
MWFCVHRKTQGHLQLVTRRSTTANVSGFAQIAPAAQRHTRALKPFLRLDEGLTVRGGYDEVGVYDCFWSNSRGLWEPSGKTLFPATARDAAPRQSATSTAPQLRRCVDASSSKLSMGHLRTRWHPSFGTPTWSLP